MMKIAILSLLLAVGSARAVSFVPPSAVSLLDLRGGASRRKSNRGGRTGSLAKSVRDKSSSSKTATGKRKVGKQQVEKSKAGDLWNKYKSVPLLTRCYITMVGLTTLLGLGLGEELAQAVMALDPSRVLYGMEYWRVFTAASFLGKPSISWLMSGYYLYEYGSQLERAYGPSQFFMMLASQIALLSMASSLFGMPFFTNSVITAMLHVLSRTTPHEKVGWLIFKVPYWTLPYGLMFADVLQAQSAASALPHVLGILTGHFYYFHKTVWPKLEHGEDWLTAPGWLARRLDPELRKSKSAIEAALQKRKRGRGKKLA